MTITTIGVDLAKNSFQLHGADHTGRTVLRKKLSRSRLLAFFADLPACTVGMEACGGAHHWARELTRLGHTVRLMPPQYVKPDVKRNKHDAATPRPAAKPSSGRACASSRSRARSSNAS